MRYNIIKTKHEYSYMLSYIFTCSFVNTMPKYIHTTINPQTRKPTHPHTHTHTNTYTYLIK